MTRSVATDFGARQAVHIKCCPCRIIAIGTKLLSGHCNSHPQSGHRIFAFRSIIQVTRQQSLVTFSARHIGDGRDLLQGSLHSFCKNKSKMWKGCNNVNILRESCIV